MNHGSKNFQPSGILQRTILQNVRLITAQANEMEWSSTLSLLTKKYFLLLYKNKKKKKRNFTTKDISPQDSRQQDYITAYQKVSYVY